jgi:predicted P-loop ATPase
VRTVKCACIPDYFNKQAFILVHSAQNSGKSTFCRFLCPPSLSDYIAEDISNDKDARILLCKNFLINLDELAVLSRQEINSLKSYFSKTQINERLPYERKNSIINRTCSFVGSTNMDEFLTDETGSVRWLCFRINSISWDYRAQMDINRVWAHAYALAQDKSFESELTRDDIISNEERNKDFQIMSREKALIHKFFKIPENEFDREFLTATDIDLYLRQRTSEFRLTTVAIGKALKSLGYERIKQDGIYGYFVAKKE